METLYIVTALTVAALVVAGTRNIERLTRDRDKDVVYRKVGRKWIKVEL